MSVLFISHSNVDQTTARRLLEWLTTHEAWTRDQIFFSGDIPSGEEWRPRIDQALDECEVLLALLSDDYKGPQCVREFTVAETKGKRIITLLVRPLRGALPDFLTDAQYIDISDPRVEEAGLAALRDALFAAGAAPGSFPWPPRDDPDRAVYRGLQALDVQDAAIFFGRTAAINQGLDKLRQMRNGSSHRILVVLGASGAGKSSFLRAGLIARLNQDRQNFLALPAIRPERAAVTSSYGLAASLKAMLGREIPPNFTAADVLSGFQALRLRALERIKQATRASGRVHNQKPPTIVIPIDQGEELFGVQNSEKERFCAILGEVLERDPNVIALFTIRTDSYPGLQNEPAFARTPQDTYSLPAITSFREIIEGPAALAKPAIYIQPELSDKLIADLQGADALPLLGFTLERLHTYCGQDGNLTLEEYTDEFGGLSGAIKMAVTAVLGDEPTEEDLKVARSLFVPRLVKVDEEGVKRLTARKTGWPRKEQALADRFIAQRLLFSDRRMLGGRDEEIIEVAHEAILRQWTELAAWIEEDRDDLHDLERLRRAARDWRLKGCTETWLMHQADRLQRAHEILARPDYGIADNVAEVRDYLEACDKAEHNRKGQARAKDEEIVALRAQNQNFKKQIEAATREEKNAIKERDELRQRAAAAETNGATAEALREKLAASEARVHRAESAVVALKKREAAPPPTPPPSPSVQPSAFATTLRGGASDSKRGWDDDDYDTGQRWRRGDTSIPWKEIGAGVAIGAAVCVLAASALTFTQWGRDRFAILDRGHGWITRNAEGVSGAVGGMFAPQAESAQSTSSETCDPQMFFAGGDGANVRAAPNRSSAAIERLPAGVSVTTSGCPTPQDGRRWHAVTLEDGRSGFVRDDVLSVTPPAPPARLQVANFVPPEPLLAGQNGVYVREAPSREADVLVELDPDTPLSVNGRVEVAGQDWYRVRLRDGRAGFVRADVAEVAQPLVVATSSSPAISNYTPPSPLFAGEDGANIRATPQRDGRLLTRLEPGARLTVTGRAEMAGHDWYRVAIPGGLIGYVREDVVAAAPPPPGPIDTRSVDWARRPTAVQIQAAYFRRPGPLSGRVEMQMRCVVQSDGGLDDCTVVRPQESSRTLQAAADRVARLYRMESVRRDGASVVGRPILLSVTFDSNGGSTSD